MGDMTLFNNNLTPNPHKGGTMLSSLTPPHSASAWDVDYDAMFKRFAAMACNRADAARDADRADAVDVLFNDVADNGGVFVATDGSFVDAAAACATAQAFVQRAYRLAHC